MPVNTCILLLREFANDYTNIFILPKFIEYTLCTRHLPGFVESTETCIRLRPRSKATHGL